MYVHKKHIALQRKKNHKNKVVLQEKEKKLSVIILARNVILTHSQLKHITIQDISTLLSVTFWSFFLSLYEFAGQNSQNVSFFQKMNILSLLFFSLAFAYVYGK